jgi:hypothetical protein
MKAPRVGLEGAHGGGIAGEFPGALVEGEVELQGESGDVGGGGAKEAAEGSVVAGAEAVVEGFVGRVGGGGEGGFGGAVAGEGAVPPFFVIPAKAGTQGHGRISWSRTGVPGSRIKSGMTGEGNRRHARSA